MKKKSLSHWTVPMRGAIVGLLLLFVACTVGGGDGPGPIRGAKAAVAQLNAASQPEPEMEAMEVEGDIEYVDTEEGAEMEVVEVDDVEVETAAAAPAEGVANGAEGIVPVEDDGVEFIDFTDEVVELDGQMETREVDGSALMTVSLNDVSLEDTVRMFAQTAGANVIAPGMLMEGMRVTVNLKDVDWQPALRAILEVHGLALVESPAGSGVFSIQTKSPDAPEPTQVETFFLEYTTVNEISDSVKGMLKSNSVITLFPSRNAIVIRSTEDNLREVASLIKQLDRPGRQVLIETKIMELSDDAVKQLGIRWDSLAEFGMEASAGPFSRDREKYDDQTRTSQRESGTLQSRANVNRTFREQSNYRLEEFGNRDYAPINFYGSDGQVLSDTLGGVTQDPQNPGSMPSAAPVYNPGAETFVFDGASYRTASGVANNFVDHIVDKQSAILELDTLKVVLSALEKVDGVSIVSNPKMIVTSGSTNSFFSVGRRDPIIESELKRGTAESPGDTITSKLMDTEIKTDLIEGGYFRTGVDLAVVATVKTDDYIEALIRPSLRRLIEFKEVGVNSWPIISVKEINTTFTLRSGQTVAIGGLTDVQDSKATTRVPFLGSIPLIGKYLFTHQKDVKKQVETIIFVTLSVADPGTLVENAAIPEDARLVHKRRIQELASREEHAIEVQKMVEAKKAADAKKEAEAAKKEEPVAAPVAEESVVAPVAEVPVAVPAEAPFAVIRESEAVVE